MCFFYWHVYPLMVWNGAIIFSCQCGLKQCGFEIWVRGFSYIISIIKFHNVLDESKVHSCSSHLPLSAAKHTSYYMFSLESPASLNTLSVFNDPNVGGLKRESLRMRPRPQGKSVYSIRCWLCTVILYLSLKYWQLFIMLLLMQTITLLTSRPLCCYDFLLTAQLPLLSGWVTHLDTHTLTHTGRERGRGR